jgi:hypothetical protein
MRFWKVIVLTVTAMAILIPGLAYAHGIHKAPIAESYNGRIIDDILFINSSSMTEAAIQAFLDGKVVSCQSGYTCLKDYVDPSVEKKASRIIYEESQRVGLNAQVILATLQKEQRLVTDDFPYDSQYRSAMGYGCPESQSVCDSKYYGFYNQVRLGATLLRVGLDRFCGNNTSFPGWSFGSAWYTGDNDRRNPFTIDGKDTYIATCASASLMNYTPHRVDSGWLPAGDSNHYYGNYNFIYFYSNWFSPTQSDDTLNPHPDGTLVLLGNQVFLNYNGQRRHVLTPAIFNSYFYRWSEVKPGTTGDFNLPIGPLLDVLRPGTLFRSPSSSVYVMAWDSTAATWKKQLVTYTAFNSLGFRWDEVQLVADADIPTATMPTTVADNRHPDGTLIKISGDPRVYLLDHGTRRHILYGEAFMSYGFGWHNIKNATNVDASLPLGAQLSYEEGTILFDGANLYVADLPPTGEIIKRPIGPWSCFADRLKYSLTEAYRVPVSQLPPVTGSLVTC